MEGVWEGAEGGGVLNMGGGAFTLKSDVRC
jgi:hypothetical protein